MWAIAQRDGRPAEYRWRPLFNGAQTNRNRNRIIIMIDYCLHAVGARLAVPLPVPAQDGVKLGGKCNSRRFECLGGRSKQTEQACS